MPFDARSLTGAQLRAARALLNMSGQELAERSKLGLATIRRAEAEDGPVKLTYVNASHIVQALEGLGVIFLSASTEDGEGVRRSRLASKPDQNVRRNAEKAKKRALSQ